ncbi:MAG: hypothetical protein ETSY1_25880 [Candidatus Entotheonella factor]|uniref:Uncharacterized protein n=1 Tax=Entotheonella factor TaxID=1429438 RepID=W4LFD5_ENTF1|nr:MAG: hypothetical protein ETSY1_25880 [Candidatus Entotheonella factor]
MAKRISEKEIASVRLLELELSEDEVTVLSSALALQLKQLDDHQLEASVGASREEAEAILQDLYRFLNQPLQQSLSR